VRLGELTYAQWFINNNQWHNIYYYLCADLIEALLVFKEIVVCLYYCFFR
jgi:hypothetical protein